MARLTGPGKKLGVSQSSNAAKVAANKAKVEANRKKVQANAAKYKSTTPTTTTKKAPAMANQKVAQGVKVTANAPGYGFLPLSESIKTRKENYPGEFRTSEKQYKSQIYNTKLPADSAKYFQTLSKINPSIAESTRSSMAKEQSRVKKLFPNATFSYSKAGGSTSKNATPNMKVKFNTPVNKMTPAQKAYYEKKGTK